MTIYSALPALGAIITLLLGSFVQLRERRSKSNQAFSFICFTASLWLLSHTVAYSTSNTDLATLFTRIGCTIVVLVPMFLYQLVVAFLGLEEEKPRVQFCWGANIFIVALFLATDLLHSGSYHYFWGFYSKAGPLHPTYLIITYTIWLRSFYLLYRSFKSMPPSPKRNQVKYILAASILGVPATIDYIPKYGIEFYPFGFVFVILFAIVSAYAIIQHNFLDIHVVIRKSLAYSILVSILTIGYFSLIYLAEQFSRSTLGYQSTGISLLAFALMALAFQPLKNSIQRLVDWVVFRTPQEILAKRVERLEEQALLAEKFKAASTLAAGMAHEIKNPLTAINTFTEFIPEKHADPAFAAKLHQILAMETKRIQGLVQEVLEFAKPKDPKTKSIDPELLINSTINLLSGDLLRKKIRWEIDYQHNGHKVQADPDQLRQVLINLIQNATDAMPAGGQLTITTQPVNGYLEMTVADTGEGIPKNLLPKVFDPFVTTKEDGNGLGLAMVYSILRANYGSIRVENLPSRGSIFTVSLPT